MKKSLLLFLAFLLTNFLFSQEFTGKAVYRTSSAMKISFGTPEKTDSARTVKKTTLSVAEQGSINKEIQRSMQKEYELTFSKKESLYKEIPKLKTTREAQGVEVIGLGGGTEGGLYKNTGSQTYIENRDAFGKLFLVKDTLKKWDWKLGNETKMVGNYTCYKATSTDGKNNITAWYTPQIPISQGPGEYWGLPGFILEVNDGKLNILCSKIILDPEKEIEIKVPAKGKETDRETFRKIYNEKIKEMMKMYDNKRQKEKS